MFIQRPTTRQLFLGNPALTVSETKKATAAALLLDAVTGVSVAYSLRKLRTAYAGSAVRVRRSSDDTEQDIGFSGSDFDAAAFSTFIGAGSGYVKTWYDQTANGNNAAQSTTSKQPQVILNALNSQPIVRFTAAQAQYLVVPDSATYKTSKIQTLFVGKFTNGGSIIIGYPHNVTHSAPYLRWGIYDGGSTWELRIDSSAPSTGTLTLNQYALWSYDTDARDVYRNGTRVYDGTGSTVTYPNAVGLYIGANSSGNENLNGDITDILVGDETLTPYRADIETNINAYYAVY